jgi:TRAP-type C4-dicarboxylate transport system permease small subunit
LLIVSALWAFSMSLIIVADVAGRSLIGTPLKGTPEIIASSIVVITFLQAGFAIQSGSMLRASFLLDRIPPPAQRVARVTGCLLGAAFFVLIVVGSWPFAVESWASSEYEGEGSLRIPSWPARFLILFGSSLAALDYLLLALLEARGIAVPGEDRGRGVPPATQ